MRTLRTKARVIVLQLGLLGAALCPSLVGASPSPFQKGDVFASVGDGLVQHYDSAGNLLDTLDTGLGNGVFTTGCGFDSAGTLYVTTFTAGGVTRFSGPEVPHSNLGAFGSGFSGLPESIVFSAYGVVYVGSVEGDNDIRKFDATGKPGKPLARFNVETERRGSDWIDLTADQKTLFYTSEGRRIFRYDMVGNRQLSDFNAFLPGTVAFALRILPDGGVLVADQEYIVRLNNLGQVIQTYDIAGENTWFAVNLDPDGTSFWAGSSGSGKFYKFDIASGGAPLIIVDTGRGAQKLYGLCVFREITSGSRDADGDELPDAWEVNGVDSIDTDGDGVPDLNLSALPEIGGGTPPDPNHKDVYVWIDWLEASDHSHKPDDAALLLVKQAFAEAPISKLNPDGKPGINLHLILGKAIAETADLQELGYEDRFIYFASEFASLKKEHFQKGGSANGMATVFHYAVYAHYLPESTYPCPTVKHRPGGIAIQLPIVGITSDFIIAHQTWRERIADGGLTPLVQAGVFMHELGHTLDLGHGGVSIYNSMNRKPNHLSVMNYSFAKGLIVRDGRGAPAKLAFPDYSRFVLPSLEEDGQLLEIGGLRGGSEIADYGTIFYNGKIDSVGSIRPFANGDIDWNYKDGIEAAPVRANINGDCTLFGNDIFSALPASSNEWEALSYKQGDIGKAAALVSDLPAETIMEEPDIPPSIIMKLVDPATTPVARACSVDADGDIDRNDIALIAAARNLSATGPTDPRDPDRNNVINVLDARQCTLRCDRPACAAQ